MSRAESGLRLVWNAEQRRTPLAEAAEGARIGTTDGLRGPEVVRIPFAHLCCGLYISGKPRTGKSMAMPHLILEDFRDEED